MKKVNGKIKFLIMVLAIYATWAIFDFEMIYTALFKSLTVFYKILPILLIVFIVMIFINLFFTTEKINKLVGQKSGVKGWVYAIIIGILISGPPYILYPMLKDLKDKGMKDSLIAALLYNRNVKIPFFPALIYYFGLNFAVVLSVNIIIFSVLNGLLIERFSAKAKE